MTAQHEAEAALAESEQFLRPTFDQLPIGVTLAGLDLRFQRVNARFSKMTGYSMEELLKRGFSDITHPDDIASDIGAGGATRGRRYRRVRAPETLRSQGRQRRLGGCCRAAGAGRDRQGAGIRDR